MIRKLFVAAIAILAIALISIAFLAGITLGLAFIFTKARPQSASTDHPETYHQPAIQAGLTPTTDHTKTHPQPTISQICPIPGIASAIALNPAQEAIAQPTISVSLDSITDPWLTPSESCELSCTSPVSVLKPLASLLLPPAKDLKSKAKSKSKTPQPSRQPDLNKMSRDALKQRCRELKIPRYSAMNKTQMITAITAIA